MKIQIPNFVKSGIDRLKTNEMNEAIKTCFYTHGLLNNAKDDLYYQQVYHIYFILYII